MLYNIYIYICININSPGYVLCLPKLKALVIDVQPMKITVKVLISFQSGHPINKIKRQNAAVTTLSLMNIRNYPYYNFTLYSQLIWLQNMLKLYSSPHLLLQRLCQQGHCRKWSLLNRALLLLQSEQMAALSVSLQILHVSHYWRIIYIYINY